METLSTPYDVIPIPTGIAAGVRATLKDPVYGLAVTVRDRGGYGPCRLCLRTFPPEETRILFLYNPFSARQEADFAGPIFIHAHECEPFSQRHTFPEQIANLPIVLRAYGSDGRFLLETSPRDGIEIDAAIEAMFDRSDVAVIHVRNAEAKCFIMKIERSTG